MYLQSSVGTSRSILPALVMGQTFMMVALSSRSAWSISALSLTFILRLSLMRANNVVVKATRPSLSIGIFILIRRL